MFGLCGLQELSIGVVGLGDCFRECCFGEMSAAGMCCMLVSVEISREFRRGCFFVSVVI